MDNVVGRERLRLQIDELKKEEEVVIQNKNSPFFNKILVGPLKHISKSEFANV